MTHSIERCKEELAQIVDGVVTGVIQSEDGEYYGFTVNNYGETYVVWILQDDEGNGPGSVEISKIDPSPYLA